jgi:hypothetical protein
VRPNWPAWRDAMRAALGPNAKLMADPVPEVRLSA